MVTLKTFRDSAILVCTDPKPFRALTRGELLSRNARLTRTDPKAFCLFSDEILIVYGILNFRVFWP